MTHIISLCRICVYVRNMLSVQPVKIWETGYARPASRGPPNGYKSIGRHTLPHRRGIKKGDADSGGVARAIRIPVRRRARLNGGKQELNGCLTYRIIPVRQATNIANN